MAKDSDDQYSDKEAQRRFQEALRGGLSTPPKPLKSIKRIKTATDKRRARKKKNND